MISGYQSRPVFQYKYRPLPLNGVTPPNGGFSVLLYGNNILSFGIYDIRSFCTDEVCFPLPARVLSCFFGLMNNARSWLGSTPCDLRSTALPDSGSFFAFDGFEPILIYGLSELLTNGLGSHDGYYARHVYTLFEDVCIVLREAGINLTADSFSWDPSLVRPFRRPNRGNTGTQRVI